MIKVAIAGATGYTGQEAVRLLAQHPQVQITHLCSHQSAGKPVQDLFGSQANLPETFDVFDPKNPLDCDCLFLALPHGTVHPVMTDLTKWSCKIIDLSADFRLNDPSSFESFYKQTHQAPDLLETIPYGLPELHATDIKQAKSVANPGCYATTTILGLYPLAKERLIEHAVVDAKSGVSGAGKGLSETTHYCESNEHVSAYSTNAHRHQAELAEQCGCNITFSPHLMPMTRGIMASCYIQLTDAVTLDQVTTLYQDHYKDQPFISICGPDHRPSTQDVIGTNRCVITLKQVTENNVILFSCSDNLIKGAAGQAIQNMNLMFNLDQSVGLPLIAQRV